MLEKIRPKGLPTRINKEKSNERRRLDEIAKINKKLANYLIDPQFSVPLPSEKDKVYDYQHYFHRDRQTPIYIFEVIRKTYTCTCEQPHYVDFRCRCPSWNHPFKDGEAHKNLWMGEVTFMPQSLVGLHHTPAEIKAAMGMLSDTPTGNAPSTHESEDRFVPLLVPTWHSANLAASTGVQTPMSSHGSAIEPASLDKRTQYVAISVDREGPVGNNSGPAVSNICSAIESLGTRQDPTDERLGVVQAGRATYGLTVGEVKTDHMAVSLGDLLGSNILLSRKKRMSLAFRVTISVLGLSSTKWLDDSWTWRFISPLRNASSQTSKPRDSPPSKTPGAATEPASKKPDHRAPISIVAGVT